MPDNLAPFRQPTHDSPTLQALAHEAKTRALPQPSHHPSMRRNRLVLAADAGGGCGLLGAVGVFGLLLGCVMMCVPVVGVIIVAGSLCAIAADLEAQSTARHRAIETMLAWPETLPFPTTHWEGYVLAERPMMELVVAQPLERRTLAAAVRAIDDRIEIESLDARTFRFTLPPRVHITTSETSSSTIAFGDRALAQRLVDRLIRPLHDELGVTSLAFGGTS